MDRALKRRRVCRSAQMFKVGDVVGWEEPEAVYNEARVVYCDEDTLQTSSSHYVTVVDPEIREEVKWRGWRETVLVGDMVQFQFNCEWINCVVRGFQRDGSDKNPVLVFEPVFFGYTLSAPLDSLVLRQPFEFPEGLSDLVQSGFAFNEKDDKSKWPPYSPHGRRNLRHLNLGIERRS